MLSFLQRQRKDECSSELLTSKLYNEDTFYPSFMKDLDGCGSELIIECPFVTYRRLDRLMPAFEKLKARRVRLIVNTRDPHEYVEERRRDDAHRVIASLQRLGIHVLFTGGHHRKLVILDRNILYEGSLNVLSQNDSSEVMRRIESAQLAWQMIRFIEIDKHI